MTRYAIGMGSNLGDRLEHLVGAVEALSSSVERVSLSSVFETEPIGGPDQDPFLNAVMVVETNLDAPDLLDRLQEIEADHDRQRKVRWGPRTLDLDIVATDGTPISSERLTIPHPRAAERAFVLRPLVEVWPDATVAPGVSASDALARADGTGVDRLSAHWMPPRPTRTAHLYVGGQFVLFIAVAVGLAADGRLPEGEVTALGVIGALLALAGLIMAFVSSRRLGPAMTPSPIPKSGSSLIISGPYRFVRHPIYGGVILVLLGTALFLDSIYGAVGALALVPYFWVKSTFEEGQLRMRFAGYRAYREVVARRLIPFVI
ncbi:MAG: 2-amino-4-hydroxy-6-hydroxymethyldihydropteridine diphosphokinase [Acidimicrobiia bacterium]